MSGRRIRSTARKGTTAAAVAIAILVAASLSGCLPGRGGFSTAQDWLEKQPSVLSVTELASWIDGFTKKGTLHAELDPAATDAEVEQLAGDVAAFLDDGYRNNVIVRIGRDGADFEVPQVDQTVVVAQLWRSTVDTVGLVAGVIDWNSLVGAPQIEVRTMRPDAIAVASAIAGSITGRFGASSDVSNIKVYATGYVDASRLAEDQDQATRHEFTRNDYPFFDVPWAVTVATTPGCAPAPAVLAQAEVFVADSRIDSGHLDLCESLLVHYSGFPPLAAEAPTLRAALDAAGLTDFPVTIESSGGEDYDSPSRSVQVTPGNPAAFAVLPALETPTLTPLVSYRLADGRLELADPGPEAYRLSELFEVVDDSGVVEFSELSLSSRGLTVVSAPSTIQELISLADAIDRSESVGAVVLRDSEGTIDLANDPDVDDAARAIHNSGAWAGRTLTIGYQDGTLIIADGVPGALVPDYGDVLSDFADAWAALA